MFFEELAKDGRAVPKYMLWWHDSHFERRRFKTPNNVIRKFLRYIPGEFVNGIVFINTEQAQISRKYYAEQKSAEEISTFFSRKYSKLIPQRPAEYPLSSA